MGRYIPICFYHFLLNPIWLKFFIFALSLKSAHLNLITIHAQMRMENRLALKKLPEAPIWTDLKGWRCWDSEGPISYVAINSLSLTNGLEKVQAAICQIKGNSQHIFAFARGMLLLTVDILLRCYGLRPLKLFVRGINPLTETWASVTTSLDPRGLAVQQVSLTPWLSFV